MRSSNPIYGLSIALFLLLPALGSAADNRSCKDLYAAASHGEALASYTLAGEFMIPGGCGHNYRTAYRYLEIGAREIEPVKGLLPVAANTEGVYLLAAWARKEMGLPEYSVDSSVLNDQSVTDVAKAISHARAKQPRTKPIPPIPNVPLSQSFDNLASVVTDQSADLNKVREAILSSLVSLRSHGFSQATFELALYFHASPFDQDQKRSRDLLTEAARAGHRSAAVTLGQAVEKGEWGFDKDVPLACAIYKSVDALGCPVRNPGPVDPDYQRLIQILRSGAPKVGYYKGPPVPYMNTNTDGIWWVLENAFLF